MADTSVEETSVSKPSMRACSKDIMQALKFQQINEESFDNSDNVDLEVLTRVLRGFKLSLANHPRDNWSLLTQAHKNQQTKVPEVITKPQFRKRNRNLEEDECKTPMAINVPDILPHTSNWSRYDIVDWVNRSLGSNLACIEELGRGDAYVRLMQILFPGSVCLHKIKLGGRDAYIGNFKILRNAFKRIQVTKVIPVEILVKQGYHDNFEFAQWFKRFFLVNYMQNHNGGRKFNKFNNYHI